MGTHWKIILSYMGGSVIWFVLLGFLVATQDIINALIANYVGLTAGLALGGYGQSLLRRRPWLLLFVPSLPIVIGYFG